MEPERWITVNGRHIPLFDGESKEDAIRRATNSIIDRNEDDKEKQIQKNKEQANKLNNKKSDEKINEMNKDGSITMAYVHIKNNTQKIKGMDFGQDIEPAGEYMSMDTLQGKNKVQADNYEYGTIHFKKPLVLEHKNTRSTGWKKDLSEMYGGKKKKALSNAIMKDGYDAIMTWEIVRGEKVWSEIVNLKGEKR